MGFSTEQNKYIIQRIKFSYSKGFYEGMTSGVVLGIAIGTSILMYGGQF